MGILDLPLEIQLRILSLLPGRQDLLNWRCLCTSTDRILQEYQSHLNVCCIHKHGVDPTLSSTYPSSLVVFREWIRIRPRNDASVIGVGRRLFNDYSARGGEEESEEEGREREKEAELVIRDVREYIGEDRFTMHFRAALQKEIGPPDDCPVWSMDIVDCFFSDAREIALQLTQVALQTLKSLGIPSNQYSAHQWALQHLSILENGDRWAAGRFAKAMLDDVLEHETLSGPMAQFWAKECYESYQMDF